MKHALITGINGQDGSYLAEQLLDQGYEVHGIIRRSSMFSLGRLDGIRDRIHLHYGDVLDSMSLERLLGKLRPHKIFHLAAQSHVRISFEMPLFTFRVNTEGTLNLLEAVRYVSPESRFYQASSSEMFGEGEMLTEQSPFRPRSPYASSKVAAHDLVASYRRAYGLFAVNGILFNHESPRRGENFVTRKIARGAASIAQGNQSHLSLGNLDSHRDWGYAPEYTQGMIRMMDQDEPQDFVLATGYSTTVREVVRLAFEYVGLDWRNHVVSDPYQIRPADIQMIRGDASKARRKLGWEPKTSLQELVALMVDFELKNS